MSCRPVDVETASANVELTNCGTVVDAESVEDDPSAERLNGKEDVTSAVEVDNGANERHGERATDAARDPSVSCAGVHASRGFACVVWRSDCALVEAIRARSWQIRANTMREARR